MDMILCATFLCMHLGQTGLPTVTYPYLAEMTLGWSNAWHDAQNQVPFRPGINLGGITLLEHAGNRGFAILGLTGPPTVAYRYLAETAHDIWLKQPKAGPTSEIKTEICWPNFGGALSKVRGHAG